MKNEKDATRIGIIILVASSLLFIGLGSVGVIVVSRKMKENEAAKVEKVKQNRQALGELTAVSDKLNAELRDKIGKEDAVEGSTEKAKQLGDAMGKAAAKASGDDAKAMLAGQRLMASLQGSMAAYEKAYSAFLAKGGVAPGNLASSDDITERLALLKAFESANRDFLDSLKDVEGKYRAELLKDNMSATKANIMAQQFYAGGKFDTIISIRGTDQELCVLMGDLLRFLQGAWGTWRVNDQGITIFQRTADLKTFTDFQAQIKEVGDRQILLQQKLLQNKQAHPSPVKVEAGKP